MAKIKADFRKFSFLNLVRENIPIQVCDISTVTQGPAEKPDVFLS